MVPRTKIFLWTILVATDGLNFIWQQATNFNDVAMNWITWIECFYVFWLRLKWFADLQIIFCITHEKHWRITLLVTKKHVIHSKPCIVQKFVVFSLYPEAINFNKFFFLSRGNIPGSAVNEGEVLCNYLQPFPPKGTGFHRHVFLLFHQSKKLDFTAHKRPSNWYAH